MKVMFSRCIVASLATWVLPVLSSLLTVTGQSSSVVHSDESVRTRNHTLFVHVFKAGGTSEEAALKRWAKCHDVPFLGYTAWIRHEYDEGRSSDIFPQRASLTLNEQQRATLQRHPLVFGHMSQCVADYFPSKSVSLVTTLREPTTQFLSGILYRSRSAATASTSTLDHAVRGVSAALEIKMRNRDKKLRSNRSLEWYTGLHEWFLDRDSLSSLRDRSKDRTYRDEYASMTATAEQNMKRFDLLGIMECWDDSMDLLRVTLAENHPNVRSHCDIERLWRRSKTIRLNARNQSNAEVPLIKPRGKVYKLAGNTTLYTTADVYAQLPRDIRDFLAGFMTPATILYNFGLSVFEQQLCVKLGRCNMDCTRKLGQRQLNGPWQS